MERGSLRRRFTELRSEVHDSFWFVPALLMAAAVLLAQGTLWLDRTRAEGLGENVSWLFGGTAEGAWTLLQVIAGSLITVISVAFSVTLIAIQQASAQFSPRLLRNFTSDRANQLVLGSYVATFVYALLVLRDVREGNDDSGAFVPALSLFVAIVLAVVSLGMLVFFIHHITMSLQLAYLLGQIRSELDLEIERQFPETFGPECREPPSARSVLRDLADRTRAEPLLICSRAEGYLRRIQEDELRAGTDELGRGNFDTLLEVPVQVGQYVGRHALLLRVWSAVDVPDSARELLRNAFDLGRYRSVAQDPSFGFEQMTDVAVKALSPGINDPTTAIQSLDQIASALRLVQERRLPAPERKLSEGVRCVFTTPTFRDFVEASVGRIQRAARSDWGVQWHILVLLDDLASRCPSVERAEVLRRQVSELVAGLAQSSFTVRDEERLRARAAHVLRTLQKVPFISQRV